MTASTRQFDRLADLRRQVEAWEGRYHHQPVAGEAVLPSGVPSLDAVLPQGGLKGYELMEWFSEWPGSGAGRMAWTVAVRAARITVRRGFQRVIVVVDPNRTFYPPAAVQGDLDPRAIVLVRPRNLAELIWVWDQALRSTAVAAVWGTVPRIDPRDFRRMQLAAEQGHTLGLLLRSAKLQRDPSWAHIRLRVAPRSSPSIKLLRQKR